VADLIDSRFTSKHSLVLALAVALALFLPACSDDSGVEDSGQTFKYMLPAGWSDESDRAEEVGPPFGLSPASVRSIASSDPALPFTSSVFVVLTPAGLGDLSLEEFGRATVREVRLAYSERAGAVAGGTPPAAVPGPSLPGRQTRTEVGDEPALQFDYASASASGSSGKIRNVAVVHDGSPYLLRFVAAEPNFDTDLEAFEEILDSWRWD
jgi:hypothetical protein